MRRRILIAGAAVLVAALAGSLLLGRYQHVGPFAPEPWRNVDTGKVADALEYRGPAHCGWNHTTFLSFGKGSYVRDEDQRFAVDVTVPYDPTATLTADAEFTGWQRGDRQLWVSPAEKLGKGVYTSVYLVSGDVVERWPQITVGCQ